MTLIYSLIVQEINAVNSPDQYNQFSCSSFRTDSSIWKSDSSCSKFGIDPTIFEIQNSKKVVS